jgi:tetratricopeptide (TPR) repeat protein
MFCYNCGCLLSEHDFCTACGADVGTYKKIMYVSNRFYNDGLEKAQVRDLTGAINSLRQSLKFNKNNIDARNLLGLVYFETGEVVAAMSEWVISKNLKSDKNIADDYLDMLQSNAGRLDSLNQTIKKYNQAYTYCVQDSRDLAIIQLKKVLSLNPRFIRAHQLLALLYIDSEQLEKAERELKKCMDIDRNNTRTLRYLKEVKQMLTPDDSSRQQIKRKKDDAVRYQSDNEVIIQPLNVKEQKGGGVSTLVNIGIGLLIGLAAMYFLVVPARVANVKSESQKSIAEIGNQLDAKNVTIQTLESQIDALTSENEGLNNELQDYVGTDGTLKTIDSLLDAATHYIGAANAVETGDELEAISQAVNIEDTSEAFQGLYNTLLSLVGPELSKNYYNDGYTAYRTDDYNTAIELLSKAVYYDETNRDALYSLAMAYRGNGNDDEAVATFTKYIELFPMTDRAATAERYINEIQAPSN